MRCAAVALAAAFLVSCKGEVVDESAMRTAADRAAASAAATGSAMPGDAWASLVGTRVFFGHQSVGANLLQGLQELQAAQPGQAAPPLRVASLDAARGSPEPVLAEFRIGENGAPASKIAAFQAALDSLGPDARGVALFKYCYLDITAQTDVQDLFRQHAAAVATMRARHPGLTFVHVTAPLTADEPLPRRLLKGVLGKPTARDANARRAAFNAMLRRTYAGEPVLDLARVESTRPDGSRSFVTNGADTVHTLAPELTDDGGHLNAAGRRAAATEFVAVVAAAARASAAAPVVAQRAAP